MEELKDFIKWLSTTEDFLGMDDSQIIDALNTKYKSEEGQQKIKKLMMNYKNDAKIEHASQILKGANGTKAKQRREYRNALRELKRSPEGNLYRNRALRQMA
jgi:hypothetical protein